MLNKTTGDTIVLTVSFQTEQETLSLQAVCLTTQRRTADMEKIKMVTPLVEMERQTR